jgi:4-alpha-glucanotransferase
MMDRRSSGILLHVTSLPSRYGIGDLGPGAYRFVDFLKKAHQRCWQVLSLSPVSRQGGYSPYCGLSAFAGNAYLISPEILRGQGLLRKDEVRGAEVAAGLRVDYRRAFARKRKLLDTAFKRFRKAPDRDDYGRFCSANENWLEDYAVFTAMGRWFGTAEWQKWPPGHKGRLPKVIQSVRQDLGAAVEREKFLQYTFFRQWRALRRYCNERGIRLIGDIPFYVSHESADVWGRPDIFRLGASGRPVFVSGVPPDAFSRTGQLWGNPVYDWAALAKTGYSWWVDRIRHSLDMFDFARIDHFRGFVAYWRVPAGRKTAKSGRWVRGPGGAMFDVLKSRRLCGRLIVEDLGHITPAVRNLAERYALAGMRVMQFGFGPDAEGSPHGLRNHPRNCVLYTGTHDNNTARGWFEEEAAPADRERLFAAAGHPVSAEDIHWELIRLSMGSAANTVIIPMQDVLGLGAAGRMNRPAVSGGNWRWRLEKGRAGAVIADRLAEYTRAGGRA